ncbi:virulence factor mvin superfamily [Peptoclostridium acidaminophilum DSM 3953]|uniref:Virulence factor mvin superfamily n=1 Tax=Peptoclostridium acidaminophilum DSM 3953 TaxID=1286171 RepID=W8U8K0_PEPAC|nr:oligosaccharide flippase family protein [Peptoclostridium acidaminophilum]AHM57181.1 virulence factor mvin superfamily [Peptoclostridium acidaminophilum DSM 3953]
MEKGKSQIKIGVILSYAALFLSVAISLVYTPFMLRKLGQAEYGLFSLVNSVVANLAILDFGFENAIVRYTAKYKAENDFEKEKSLHFMFFVMYSIIGIVAFAIGFVLILNIDNIFSQSLTQRELATAKTLMLIAVINISLSFPLGVFAGIIQAYERFIFLKTASIARICMTPLIMVTILIFGYRSVGIILAGAVIGMIFSLLNVMYFYKVLNKRISASKFDMQLLKGIGAYSFFVFLNIIIDRLYWATDQLILGMYVGTAAVAVYTIGAQFFNYYVQISTSISGVFLPRVVELDVKDAQGGLLSDTFIKVGRIQFLALSFVLSGFALFGKEFIAIWAGEGYENAYYVALITMIPSIIPLSQNVGISILQAKNKHAFRSIIYLFIAIFNVVLSIALVKPYGVIGCASATALGCVLGQIIIMNIYYKRKIGLDIPRYWANIGKLSVPAVVSFIICSPHSNLPLPEGLGGMFIKGLLFAGVFIFTVWIMGMNDYEKNLVASPIKNAVWKKETR